MAAPVTSQEKKARYCYDPLPKDSATHIRLLRVLSGPGEPVVCSLDPVDLDQEPQYDCLSYTWSDPLYRELSRDEVKKAVMSPDLNRTIQCGDSTIGVTENLVDALEQLGRRGYAASPEGRHGDRAYLWVDAVCIDQDNVDERSQQVTLMGKIYRQAKRVVIWLGKQEERTARGVWVLEQLAAAKPRTPNTIIQDLDDEEEMQSLGIEMFSVNLWLDYCVFLQRVWFSRIWVVQESYFAAEKEVLCGSDTIPWSNIIRCAQLLESTKLKDALKALLGRQTQNDSESIGNETGDRFDNRLNNQRIFSEISRTTVQSLNLNRLLCYSMFFDAKDARDHVYAILGIWEESQCQAQGKNTAPYKIVPDYNKNTRDVFCEATYFAIQEAGNLSILGLVEDRAFRNTAKLYELPSWVPDYSGGTKMRPLADVELYGDATPARCKRWNAGGSLVWQGLPSPGWSAKLPVNGLPVDQIEEPGPCYLCFDLFHTKSLLDILANYPNPHSGYPGGGSVCDAFWKTVIKDTFRGTRAGEEARVAFPPFLAERIRELRVEINEINGRSPEEIADLSTLLRDTESLVESLAVKYANERVIPTMKQVENMIQIEYREGSTEEREQARNRQDMQESFRAAYFGRRVFRTRAGYYGIAAQSLVPGDSVWLLAGASTPFVLRQVGKNDWQVVGEAYVYGIMQDDQARLDGGESNSEGSRQIQLV